MPDIAGNSSTTSTIAVGGVVSDTLDFKGDHDWFRIELVAGQKVTIALNGITLEDPYLRVYDASNSLLAENDDISLGVVTDSKLVFTATYSGVFYIDVGALRRTTLAPTSSTSTYIRRRRSQPIARSPITSPTAFGAVKVAISMPPKAARSLMISIRLWTKTV